MAPPGRVELTVFGLRVRCPCRWTMGACCCAGKQGFEPRIPAPEAGVLPVTPLAKVLCCKDFLGTPTEIRTRKNLLERQACLSIPPPGQETTCWRHATGTGPVRNGDPRDLTVGWPHAPSAPPHGSGPSRSERSLGVVGAPHAPGRPRQHQQVERSTKELNPRPFSRPPCFRDRLPHRGRDAP